MQVPGCQRTLCSVAHSPVCCAFTEAPVTPTPLVGHSQAVLHQGKDWLTRPFLWLIKYWLLFFLIILTRGYYFFLTDF